MKSVFDIARSHITLPVSKDGSALRQVLRDWLSYSERVPLQKKPAFPAELSVTVYAPRGGTPHEAQIVRPLRYTRRVPLLLWTAVLPWEVQRGLSMSLLEPPEQDTVEDGCAEKPEDSLGNDSKAAVKEEEEEEDPFGVVSDFSRTSEGLVCDIPASGTVVTPSPTAGMLFVMSPESASEGLHFWSGGINYPIDIAFITALEPVATSTDSFSELRRKRINAASSGYDVSRFFPDGELDSPTVAFAVQSHSYLDPFPRCDATSRATGDGIDTSARRYTAQPVGLSKDEYRGVRYVLETRRHFLGEAINIALQEYSALLKSADEAPDGRATGTPMSKSLNEGEVTVLLELSDALKSELREKARLYTNYVVPLEGHVRRYIKQQSGISVGTRGSDEDARGARLNNDLTTTSENSITDSDSKGVVSVIQPSVSAVVSGKRVHSPRSPMLADEAEGRSVNLAPGICGRHSAPTLEHAQREQNTFISANALARSPRTSPHPPRVPPIDYELFDLCLRLGLCQSDAIYHFYHRIMQEWREELRKLRAGDSADGGSTLLSEENVHRMLRLVRDPSLEVPSELSACVEAVAKQRNVAITG
uniref:Uncharacterized protein n=1 Tax=Trypanosoma congolense (strain IL3000) TaxID=1068625 RepID=G0UMS9_TRYCI|nr:conserved hypothetical protein [Trypanosoma congolense IL3000]